jgi:metal-sulfur cluster biosynthetic enzyme
MTPTRDAILLQLRKVREPCSILMRNPIDICEMGLVEDIRVVSGHVVVELCLTDPSCVHFNALQQYIIDELRQLEGVVSVEVTQTTLTLWTPDRVGRDRVNA